MNQHRRRVCSPRLAADAVGIVAAALAGTAYAASTGVTATASDTIVTLKSNRDLPYSGGQ
jgi:hypothetical protein